MSIDIADIASLSFQNQASLATAVDPVSLIEAGASFEAALSLANAQSGDSVGALLSVGAGQGDGLGDAVGLPAEASAGGWEIIDDSGGGYIDVYAEPMYAPEGFYAEDLYEIEFLLDTSSGELTILLHFSQDPLDYMNAASLGLFDLMDSVALGPGDLDGDDLGSLAATPAPPKCTITITKTITQNSGSTTFNFNTGIVNGSVTSGSTSSTTTQTVSVQGVLIGGRCVIKIK